MTADPTRRFSDRASYYARWRPGYPPALLAFFRSTLGLRPASVVADIGSGTGILTELLLENGNAVAAVEPNAQMRQAAESALKKFPSFRSVDATAEATGLGGHSVDLITAAQAFHWFDRDKARAEFARILAPGGWVALVWNERRTQSDPFGAAYQTFIDAFSIDQFVEHHRTLTEGDRLAMHRFFEPSGFSVAEFENEQVQDLEGLQGRVLSSSHMPLPGHPTYAAMIERLTQLYDEHQVGGVIRARYDTRVYYGHIL